MKKKSNLKNNIEITVLLVVLGLILLFFIYNSSAIYSIIKSDTPLEDLKAFVESFGFFGAVCLMILQAVQVIIAILPSEPFEIVAGMCYGAFWSFVITQAGLILGMAIVFFAIKVFGKRLALFVHGEEKLSQFKFLDSPQKLRTMTFILFFIPGLPKDIFTYFAPLTKIKMSHFLIISAVARTPTVIISCLTGSQLVKGNFTSTAILFGITFVLGILGLFLYNLYFKKHKKE